MAIGTEITSSQPPLDTGVSKSSEQKLPFNREPQQLARNPHKRFEQLNAIAQKPTETQLAQITEKLVADNPDVGAESAGNVIGNISSLLQERKATDEAVKRARSQALAAPNRDAFEEGRQVLRDLQARQRQIDSELNNVGSFLQEAGVKVDPSQIPLNLSEKTRLGVHEVGKGIAAVGANVGDAAINAVRTVSNTATAGLEAGKSIVNSGVAGVRSGVELGTGGIQAGVKMATETVGAGVKAGTEGVKLAGETVAAGIDLGRKTIQATVESSVGALKSVRSGGDAAWNGLLSSLQKGIETQTQNVGGSFSRFFGGLRREAGNASEKIAGLSTGAGKAINVWTEQIGKEVSKVVSSATSNAESLIQVANKAASEQLSSFNAAMSSVGENAKKGLEQSAQPILKFVEEQAQRVVTIEQQVKDRIIQEVGQATKKGESFLAPAWASIQKDRLEARQRNSLLLNKVGLAVESASDVLNPIKDRILEEGRDARDGAVGFGRKGIKGVQTFGRDVSHLATEKATPIWGFLTERWEALRLSSNDSKNRLNKFLDGKLGSTGARLKLLEESASARAEKAKQFMTDVKVEAGKVFQGGVEAPAHVAKWFQQESKVAHEFFERRGTEIAGAVERMRRYWEIYAVSKWQEIGLSKPEIGNRLKLMRGMGAASLANAAGEITKGAGKVSQKAVAVGGQVVDVAGSFGSRVGGEALAIGDTVLHSPEGRIAVGAGLGLGSLYLLAGANPDINVALETLHHGIESLSSTMNTIDISSIFGSGQSAASTPGVEALDTLSNINGGGLTDSVLQTDLSQGLGTSLGIENNTSVAPLDSNVPASIDLSANVPTGADLGNESINSSTLPAVETSANVITQDAFVEIVNKIKPGEPVAEQINQLMPGATDKEQLEVLIKVLQGNMENFLSTAQSIVNGTGAEQFLGRSYSAEEITSAKSQLDTIAEIEKDPSILYNMEPQAALAKIAQALHWWHA